MLQRTTNHCCRRTAAYKPSTTAASPTKSSDPSIHLHHISGRPIPSSNHRSLSLSHIRLPLPLHALDWPSAELLGVFDRREFLSVELLQEEIRCLWIGETVDRMVENGGRQVRS